jgi:hypothetical protein
MMGRLDRKGLMDVKSWAVKEDQDRSPHFKKAKNPKTSDGNSFTC